MPNYWLSKTHVRIEPNEMTREEALAIAKELIVVLSGNLTRVNTKWTPEKDAELKALREQNVPLREIARRILGDDNKANAIVHRVIRLRLPVSNKRRKNGLASVAARRAKPTAVA